MNGIKAVAISSTQGPRDPAAFEERLALHTAVVRAIPADALLLDERDTCTEPGREGRRLHSGGPSADHDQIAVLHLFPKLSTTRRWCCVIQITDPAMAESVMLITDRRACR